MRLYSIRGGNPVFQGYYFLILQNQSNINSISTKLKEQSRLTLVTVAAGETKSISFSSASTTTLVFSKSTCRAFINLFNCWGGNALGLDDLAVFSAGPFWTLFGGRMVSLSTVGDWSKIPVADSIATIKTQ